MNTVIFTKDIKGFYNLHELINNNIDNLALFLVNEIVDDPAWWLSHLKGPETQGVFGNITYLDKKDDLVFIGNYRKHHDDPHAFSMANKDLVIIINAWEKLYTDKAINMMCLVDEQGIVSLKGYINKLQQLELE